jgi:hypothetical protein
VLLTLKLLSLLTFKVLLTLELILFDESGPVLLMLASLVMSLELGAAQLLTPPLLTVAEAFKLLLLLALPEVASPPVVFSCVLALPVLELWLLLLLAEMLLSLSIFALLCT